MKKLIIKLINDSEKQRMLRSDIFKHLLSGGMVSRKLIRGSLKELESDGLVLVRDVAGRNYPVSEYYLPKE